VVHRQWLPLHHSTSVRNHILQSQSTETKFLDMRLHTEKLVMWPWSLLMELERGEKNNNPQKKTKNSSDTENREASRTVWRF